MSIRKPAADGTPPQDGPAVDITAPVSDEDYTRCLTLMWAGITAAASRHSWCPTWRRQAYAVSHCFPGHATDRFDLTRAAYAWPAPREELNESGIARMEAAAGEHNRAALERARKVILGYVVAGDATLQEANELFRVCGLPQYPVYTDQLFRAAFSAVMLRAPDALTGDALNAALSHAFTQMLDALPEGVIVPAGQRIYAVADARRHETVAYGDYISY
jgi:hypothetical protein